MGDRKIILVGDNPFHGVSHLSQERAASRSKDLANPHNAANLVLYSVESGADGLMFTVSALTLSILKSLNGRESARQFQLYALVPNATEFVRSATRAGGLPALAAEVAKEIVSSANFRALWNGVRGTVTANSADLLTSYVAYEVSRLRSASGKRITLTSVLLHEMVTDTALAFNMDWLFRTHIAITKSLGTRPGFETRNFSYFVKKFREWGIDFDGVVVAAPFNPIGFQMCPSKEEGEASLLKAPGAEVIAFSILAAGYLDLRQAIQYVSSLPNVKGIAVGVSRKEQAVETFKVLRESFCG